MKKQLLFALFLSIPFTNKPEQSLSDHTIKCLITGVIGSAFSLGTLYLGSHFMMHKFTESLVIAGDVIMRRFLYKMNEELQHAPQPEQVPDNYIFQKVEDNFSTIALPEELMEEVEQTVEFLHNPEKFKALGAKIPRGILFIGAPGNGKTLLARAMAGESNVFFVYACASQFIETYVGVGAARIRELFAQARKHEKCIIFIDEIDAIGTKRSMDADGRGLEHAQTLNQLLNEMDGFASKDDNIIVIAATNRPDTLDDALVRPGRFDRKLEIPSPNLTQRIRILELHTKKVPLDSTVNLKIIAAGTAGFSGADLANLVNEAALFTVSWEQKVVNNEAFEAARDKVLLGKESRTTQMSEHEKEVTAYHEAGHALVRILLPDLTDPLHKVSIVPHGRALGVTHSLQERERYSTTQEEMRALIKVCLAGRIAEQITFNEIATGASNDFQKATALAHDMICTYGMSDNLGTVIYSRYSQQFNYSSETGAKIDEAVRTLIAQCYTETEELLLNNKNLLETLAQELLQKETLYSHEVYELLQLQPRKDHRFTKV